MELRISIESMFLIFEVEVLPNPRLNSPYISGGGYRTYKRE
jgi:hypothetical protein